MFLIKTNVYQRIIDVLIKNDPSFMMFVVANVLH